MNTSTRRSLFFTVVLCSLAVGSIAQASIYTWTGTGAGGSTVNWSVTTGFSPNGTPLAGDTIVFLNATNVLGVNGGTRDIVNLDASGISANQTMTSVTGGSVLNVTGTLSKGGASNFSFRSLSAVAQLSLSINVIDLNGAGTLNIGNSTVGQTLVAFSATTANINGGVMIVGIDDGATGIINALNMNGGAVSVRNLSGTSTLRVNSFSGATGEVRAGNSASGNGSHGILNIHSTGTFSYGGTLVDGVSTTPLSVLEVTKSGAGTQILSGANTYSGNTTVSDGVLRVTTGSATGSALGYGGPMGLNKTAGVTLVTGGTLDLSGNILINEAITLNGGNLINSVISSTATLNNGIASLEYTSLGTGYTGTVLTISGGGGAGATASSSVSSGTVTQISLINSGTGYTDSSSIVLTKAGGGTGFSGTAILSSLTLTGANNNIGGDGNLIIAARIEGSGGGFTKIGAGTTTLTANNTYTGTTSVTAGTLLLSAASNNIASSTVINVGTGAVLNVASVSGGFTLASSQTLQGTGTVVGNLTTGSGSVLSPGNSPGTLNVTGNLTLGNDTSMTFEMGDLVAVTGGLTLGTNFHLTSLADLANGNYDLFTYTGSLVGVGNLGSWTATGLTNSYNFLSDADSVYLQVVPEPGTSALLGLGLGVLLWRKRYSRQS